MPKRWNISRISVDKYERLPKLRQPEGYVCFFQDSATGNYFIGDSDHPKFLVKKWWNKAPNRYRLVRILKADNAVELKKSLHQRFKANWIRQHRGWFRLNSTQLREVDDFIAQDSEPLVTDTMQLDRWNLKYFAGDLYKHLPKRQLPVGYVYVAKDLYTGNYKIGYTNFPLKRIRYLEEKASGDVRYVHILQSDQAEETETYLHEQYDSRRTRPHRDWEWFRLDNAQLQEIQDLASQWPRSSQVLSKGSPSNLQSYQLQRAPAAHSSVGHRAQQVSSDTQPSKLQLSRTRQRNRAGKNFGLLFAIGVIMIAGVLVYMRNSTDDSKLGLREIDTAIQSAATNKTSPPAAIDRPAQSTPIVSTSLPASCLFVYSCPSYSCKVVGHIPSVDEMQFLSCVPGRDFKNTEWIELKYKSDKAYLPDRECSSKNYAEASTKASAPQEPAFTCNCSKKCNEMTSCTEAFFQLNECGCSYRDSDEDGIPCESLCQCE